MDKHDQITDKSRDLESEALEQKAAAHKEKTNPFRCMSATDIDKAFKYVCAHCGYGFLKSAYCPVCEEYND